MERDKKLFHGRQQDNFKWNTLCQTHLNSMSKERAKDLTTARQKLEQKPYAFFVTEYDLSLQYHVFDAVVEDVAGSWVRHITQLESGGGRFIPDGERCNLCDESIAMTMCRHDIAKRKHRNMPVFEEEHIDPVLIRRTITPRARVDGTYVSVVNKIPGHNDNAADLIGITDDNDDADLFRNDGDENNEAMGTQGMVDHPLLAGPSAVFPPVEVHHNVLASPSKLLMPAVPKHGVGTSTADLRRQVPHSTLLKQAQDAVNLVTPLCNVTQHAFSTHMYNLIDLLRTGDYSNPRHLELCIGSFAQALVGMGVKDKSAATSNMPKQRVGKSRGRNADYRLGSARSNVSGKTQRNVDSANRKVWEAIHIRTKAVAR